MAEALKDMDKGVYILNDERWFDSNVYFRYGAFIEMKTASGEAAILNENNEFIPDIRKPQFELPKFVKLPRKIVEMRKIRRNNELPLNNLEKFEILKVIHFSNAGGVYEAINKDNLQKVYIKEGRPQAGMDGNNTDGFKRIETEYIMLKKLSSVPNVVNVYDKFQAWEHNYLVEEIVEGISLNDWVAQNYPFISNKEDRLKYREQAYIFSRKLIDTINKIHSLGIGVGDLSPNNIIVNQEDMGIRLIDFEESGDLKENINIGLQTPGFASGNASNRGQADKFSLYRTILFMYMPIAHIQDIEINKEYEIISWIGNIYGKKIQVMLESLCESAYCHNLKKPQKIIGTNDVDVKDVVFNVVKGMKEYLNIDSTMLLNGDIRQYEMGDGKKNILTGGMGMIMALDRSENYIGDLETWIQRNIFDSSINDDGLFTGKAGIACILWDLGFKKQALELINKIEVLDIKDVSLLSGLSGEGLAILSLYLESRQAKLLAKVIKIAKRLTKAVDDKIHLKSSDIDFIPMGLLDGWSGVSLFFCCLYRVTEEELYLHYAEKSIKYDIDNCIPDRNGVLHIDDKFRILPYLAGGSIGVAFVIKQLYKITEKEIYIDVLNKIIGISNTICCYNPGLFRGFGSFLIFDALVNNKLTSKLDTLLVYLIKEKDYLLVPGDYGYRLSFDIFSGSSGIILALESSIQKNPYLWVPVCKKTLGKLFIY